LVIGYPYDPLIHVDLHNFTPTLHLIRGTGKKLAALKKAASSADTVYLATDMDREGEAIAQHVAERLGRDAAGKIRRITFTAITKADLQAAPAPSIAAATPTLTRREREVLILLGEGLTDEELAR
jgi:DNA topoisomerase IA